MSKRHAPISIIFCAAIALTGFGHSASAASTQGECHGILHRDHGDVVIGGTAGEGESICVVARSEQAKVLKACSTGAACQVHGTVKPCEDSGECVEITRVDKVQKN